MNIREVIPSRELNDPIDDADVLEAAQLVLELGTRASAVQRYFELRSYDTDVGYAAASILASKIQRADEIKAWSNKLTISQSDVLNKEVDPTALLINDLGLSPIDSGEYNVPKGGLIFFNFMFVHELMELYLKAGEANSPSPGLIAVTETTSNAFIWASSSDVLACRDFGIERGKASYDMILIYRNGKELVYEHGAEQLRMNLAIWKIFAEYIFRQARNRPYFKTFAGGNAELTSIERLYQNYNPLGGDGNTMMKFLRPSGKEVQMDKITRNGGVFIGDNSGPGALTVDLRPILNTLLSAGTLMRPGTPEFNKIVKSTNGISLDFGAVEGLGANWSMCDGDFLYQLDRMRNTDYQKMYDYHTIGTLNNCKGVIKNSYTTVRP